MEEYLLYLFGIENEELPVYVSLQKEGKPVKYEITGAISNYSYLLSTYYGRTHLETKVYPSIICGQENNQDIKQSLVIMQKKLDFKRAENDINSLLSKIQLDIMCINEKLYGYGYDAYIIVDDRKQFQTELKNKGLKIIKNLSVTDYGNEELVLEDIYGRWLGFGIKLDTDNWENFQNTSPAYKNK